VRGEVWVLLVVVAAAACLRLAWLSRLGIVGDEDISQLAARGILARGWPELPSGHLYWRSPLYHYLIAPLVASGVDWLPRLFPVATSLALCAAMARLGRRWVGGHAALVGAALFALSLFEISLARTDRMYAPYQLAALLAVFCVFRLWSEGGTGWGWRAIGALLLALALHEMAVTLAVLLLLAAVRRSGRERWLACAGLALVSGASVLQRDWIGWHYRAGHGPVREASASAAETGRAAVTRGADVLLRTDVTAIPVVLVLAVAAAGVGAWLGWRSAVDRSLWARLLAAGSLAAALVAAAAGHLGLGLCCITLLVLQRRELFSERYGTRALLAVTGLILLCGVGWVVGSIAHGDSAQQAVYSVLGRGLGRYVRHLALWPPFVTVAAMAGAAAVLLRAWRGTATDGERFLLATVIGVLTVRAALSSKWAMRYLADLWPLWELIAGWALVRAVTWVRGAPPAVARRTLAATAVGALVVLAMVLPGTGPRETIGFLAVRPGTTLPRGLDMSFFPDSKGAAEWLAPRLEPQDRVIATDWLSTYYYLGRLDYWTRWRGYGSQSVLVEGVPRDVYLHAQVLPDLPALRAVLETQPAWLVAGGLELAGLDDKLDPQLRQWLSARTPAFVARDGRTSVYRFVPGSTSGEAATAR